MKKIIPALILLCVFFACRKEDGHPTWETNNAVPLLRSSLTISDFVNDTLLQADTSGAISLVYQNHLYDFRLDSLFAFYDTSVTRSYTLDSLSLYSQEINYPISLGAICLNAGIIGGFIIAQNGNFFALPAFNNIATGNQLIDVDSLFQTITLITGYMDITLQNGLPVDITNLAFELRNKSNGSIVAIDTFPLIAANTTETRTISLAGKTIEGQLTASLVLNSPGSNGVPVLIDTSNAIVANLKVYDMHPSTATAIWPAQDLVNKAQPFKMKVDKVQLTRARLKSGFITIDLYSTLQDSVRFEYSLPLAYSNGIPFIAQKTLPPAPPGGTSHYFKAYDFTGYDLDLTGINHDTVNTMWNAIRASIDSTGIMKTISLTDSFYANIGFIDLLPEYAKGYLGQDTFAIAPTTTSLDFFKNIDADVFDLKDVTLNLKVNNGIGVDGRLDIKQMDAINTKKNKTVSLSGPAIASPVNIIRATDNNGQQPVTYSLSQLGLNDNNSNVSSFISNLPDKISSAATLYINPQGNVSNFNDFIYYTDGIQLDLDLEMPLNFIAGNLTLCDTATASINKADMSNIKSAVVSLFADNGMPLDATLSIYMLDANHQVIDSLLNQKTIQAAPVNNMNVVTGKKRTRADIIFDKSRMDTFFNTAYFVVKASFTTKPLQQHIKIYSDYRIDIKLTADFIYINN